MKVQTDDEIFWLTLKQSLRLIGLNVDNLDLELEWGKVMRVISLLVQVLRKSESLLMKTMHTEDSFLPRKKKYERVSLAMHTYLVTFVDKNSIGSKDNPSSLPWSLPQDWSFVGCLPVHPSLEIDHTENKWTNTTKTRNYKGANDQQETLTRIKSGNKGGREWVEGQGTVDGAKERGSKLIIIFRHLKKPFLVKQRVCAVQPFFCNGLWVSLERWWQKLKGKG